MSWTVEMAETTCFYCRQKYKVKDEVTTDHYNGEPISMHVKCRPEEPIDTLDDLEGKLKEIISIVAVERAGAQYFSGTPEWYDYVIAQIEEVLSQREAEIRKDAQLEILRGFRRRDFSLGAMYETAVLERIAKLESGTADTTGGKK